MLKRIAELLDELNEPLEKELEDFFRESERQDSATVGSEVLTGKQSELDF